MQIRAATTSDAENIKRVHLQAFDKSDAQLIADFAVNLLREKSPKKIFSFIATINDEIIGHVAFSPVYLKDNDQHFAYILAPLAVSPKH